MAEFILKNTLNIDKAVSCNVTFRPIVNKQDDGELTWQVQVSTAEEHKDGGPIAPVFVNIVSLDNLDDEIKKATEIIGSQIDWSDLVDDFRPPFVVSASPSGQNVSIDSDVIVELQDLLPSSGIDPDSIEVSINGIDVSEEIELQGDPYFFRVIWRPSLKIYDYYE